MARTPRPLRFDARWNDRRRRSARWRRRRRIVSLLLIAAIATASWLAVRWNEQRGPWQALPERIGECGTPNSGPACAIDGDTIWLAPRGEVPARRIRLTGFDAPELVGACPAERALALKARAELSGWLSGGAVSLDGGAEPPRDRYGRELRRARRADPGGGGEWLDDHMIEAGLARREGPARAGGWCAA